MARRLCAQTYSIEQKSFSGKFVQITQKKYSGVDANEVMVGGVVFFVDLCCFPRALPCVVFPGRCPGLLSTPFQGLFVVAMSGHSHSLTLSLSHLSLSHSLTSKKKRRVQIAPARHQVTLLNTGNILRSKIFDEIDDLLFCHFLRFNGC